MKASKKIIVGVLVILLSLSIVACGTSTNVEPSAGPDSSVSESTAEPSTTEPSKAEESPEAKAPEEEDSLSGTVSLNGSTSMEKMVGGLSEAFMIKYPEVTVTYDPTGSGSGITSVQNGTTDIGLSSRSLKDTETGLTSTVVAIDGIAVVVHPTNPITDLQMEQIASIFKGETTVWNEVGGSEAPIVIIGREAGSGTRDGFESIVDVEEQVPYVQELTSTGAVLAAVSANENAIGYISLSSVSEEIKVLSVGGVVPSEATVLDSSYPIQRPFVFVTAEGGTLTPQAKAFLEFCQSEEANTIISGAGVVQAS